MPKGSASGTSGTRLRPRYCALRPSTLRIARPTMRRSSWYRRISIMCALIRSLAALIRRWNERCLKAISASTPKMPESSTSTVSQPRLAAGLQSRSKRPLAMPLSAFIRRARSADVAESLELGGDVRVRLGVVELRDLLLEHVHDELLVRCVARRLRDHLDAFEQLGVELDLVSAAEHRWVSLVLVEHRVAAHARARLDSELLEDLDRHVLEPVAAVEDLAVGEQRALDELWRHQVVAVERASDVVLEDVLRNAPERRSVRVPVARIVSHEQVGGLVQARAVVDVAREIDAQDRLRAALLFVAQRLELRLQLEQQRVGLGSAFDDARIALAALAAGQVEVERVEPDAVGARLRPVDVRQIAPLTGLQHEVALVQEPGVQVDLASPALEAVVAHHDQPRVAPHVLADVADHRVHAQVDVLEHLAPGAALAMRPGLVRAGGEALVVERVLAVAVAPHHVAAQVDAREVEEQEAALRVRVPARERVVEQAHALVVHQPRLIHELRVAQRLVLERVDVLGHALGVVEAQ